MQVPRWAFLEPFNPSGSSPCTLNYLKAMNYRIPKDKSTKKPTTGNDGLERLIIQNPSDPVIPLVLEARRVQKANGYFNDEHVSIDHRLHPVYTFHPSTGRLSSRRPNLNQIPQGRGDAVKAEVAAAVRSTIIASPGFTLVEADWKAVEAVLVGYFAEDEAYIRAAKLGVHDILGSHILARQGVWPEAIDHINWSKEKIAEYVKKFKKEHPDLRAKSKVVVHGTGYGESVYAMSKLLRIPIKEAQFYFDIYCSLAPKVLKWQENTRIRAHKEGFLMNPFGYVRYFFDVLRPAEIKGVRQYSTDGSMIMVPDGSEANEVLAFLPQSSGAGMLRETLLKLDTLQNEEFFPLVPIHDSVLFEIKDEVLSYYLKVIQDVMSAPCPQLGGLEVEVEMKVGKSWDQMVEVKVA